jgi:hypothetical protein
MKVTFGPVKLFRSESRKQRMFEYALGRTPVWSKVGKEFIRLLSEVIEEGQPTPQVAYEVYDDAVGLSCTWLVSGRSVELWMDDMDGEISFQVTQDNDDADYWHDEDVRPTVLEFTSRTQMVRWLRETLTGLGEGVRNPLV